MRQVNFGLMQLRLERSNLMVRRYDSLGGGYADSVVDLRNFMPFVDYCGVNLLRWKILFYALLALYFPVLLLIAMMDGTPFFGITFCVALAGGAGLYGLGSSGGFRGRSFSVWKLQDFNSGDSFQLPGPRPSKLNAEQREFLGELAAAAGKYSKFRGFFDGMSDHCVIDIFNRLDLLRSQGVLDEKECAAIIAGRLAARRR